MASMTDSLVIGIDASNLRAGGGRTHLVELLQAAAPHLRGIRRVVIWGSDATLAGLPRAPWLEALHVKALDGNLAARVAWQTRELPRLAHREDCLLFAPGGRLPRTRQPTVVMCRNMLPFEATERRRFPPLRRLRLEMLRYAQKRSFQRADGLIFLSDYARASVLRQMRRPPRRSIVIPHGVNARFRLAPRPARPVETFRPEAPFRVLYVSYLAPYKHQVEVAHAIARLRRRIAIEIDFVGHADSRVDARKFDALRKELDPPGRWMRHHDAVPHAALTEFYANAECFVFASSCENLPNVLIEAMAAGLPIAYAARGPMPAIMGEAGESFDPESPASIAAAVERLALDWRIRERAAEDAYRLSAAFDWSVCAARTLDFLRQVAREATTDDEHHEHQR